MPRGVQGRRREIDSGVMIAALGESRTLEQAAGLVGCSAPAITARSDQDIEVKAALKGQKESREEELAISIAANRGILSKVAAEVGLDSAQAVRYHITRNPRLRQVFEEARERVVDLAEDNIFTSVEEGNLSYSWKLLQTLGKDRGYTERKEIERQVIHEVGAASTARLIEMMNQAAGNPEAVEAEFSVLSKEKQALVVAALEDAVVEDEKGVKEGEASEHELA